MAELSGYQLRVKDSKPPLITPLEMRTYKIGRGVSGKHSNRPGYLFYADPTVSAEHAALSWYDREMAFVLKNLSSTNATLVAGVTVAQGHTQTVHPGDRIRLGNLELVLERVPTSDQVARKRPGGWREALAPLRGNRRKLKVPFEALAIFTRQFSAMLDAGIPLARALHFFVEGTSSGDLGKVVDGLSEKVNSGIRLSHALRSYPEIFSDVYVALVETGEESGQLSIAMQRLADLLEKQLRMQRRIVATLTYPAILLLVSVLMVLAFIFGIVPMLVPMFASMKIDLPLPTRILLASRLFMLPVVGLALLIGGAFWLFRARIGRELERRPALRKKISQIPLTLPLMGPVARRIAVARIFYSMATMLDSGMTLIQAITRSARVTGYFWVEEQMALAKLAIVEGETIAEAFGHTEIFPVQSLQLLTLGEEASSLSTIVQYVATMYDEDADLALTNMANMLEPLLMGGMGVIAGFIVISAILPTLELINHL